MNYTLYIKDVNSGKGIGLLLKEFIFESTKKAKNKS